MKTRTRPIHDVLLTDEEKVQWFLDQVSARQKVSLFESGDELLAFLRQIRTSFKQIYQRDVPGYFIKRIAAKCGVQMDDSEKTNAKRQFAFDLMNRNANYRSNKTDLIRALEREFGETTLSYIIDDIWHDWHAAGEHPDPSIDVDVHGQQPLFDE